MRAPRLSAQTALLLEEMIASPARWRYGYDLMKKTGLAAGTLYPILARLDRIGWLDSQWQPRKKEGRPARHQYRLTPEGRVGARDMILRVSLGRRALRPS